MKIKKICAISLATMLAISLSACNRKLPTEEKEFTGSGASTIEEMKPEDGAKLVFWCNKKEYGEPLAEAFEAKYGVPVTIEEVDYDVVDKIALSGPSGEGADVFMCSYDSFQQGLSSGVFMKLEDAIVDDVTARVDETGVKSETSDGNLYGIPVSVEVNCLFYNKDLVSEPATTLEQIMDEADEYNDPTNNQFEILAAIGDGYYEYPFVSAGGYKLFGENGDDGDKPNFDTQEYVDGLTLLAKMHDVIPVTSADLNNKSSLKTAFMEGKVKYLITGPWDVTQFKDSGMNFGVTTLPTYEGEALTPFAGGKSAHVSTYTDYPIAAELFADFLVSDEGAKILYETVDGITTLKDVSNIDSIANDENIKAFNAQFTNSVPMPSITRISFYWTISQDVDKAVFDGILSPEDGQQKALDTWESSLASE